MQSKLREELWSLDTETPDMEDFKSLTYLDCVLKEVMRLYAPVTDTERMAVNDDMIPLEDGGSIRFVTKESQLRTRIHLQIGFLLEIGSRSPSLR